MPLTRTNILIGFNITTYFHNAVQKEKVLIFKKDEECTKVLKCNMRALIVYPWQVEEFMQWLEPDVSRWPLDVVIEALSNVSNEELIMLHVVPALSRYDCLKWFEDGRLVGNKNHGSQEIVHDLRDYRFNGLFYSGLFDTEGEPDW